MMSTQSTLPRTAAAVAAVLLLIASGTTTGFRSGVPASPTPVPYTAPQVTFTSWILPDTFGPQANNGTDIELIAAMQDPLTTIDDHLQVRPDLALELPTTANGGARIVGGNLVVTWHLKPNLRWADGTPLVAQQAIILARMQETPEGSYPAAIDLIDRMTAPDPRTLVVTYRGVYGSYLYSPPYFYNYQDGARKYGAGDVSRYAMGAYDRATWQKYVRGGGAETAAYRASPLYRMITGWQADTFTKPDDGYWNGPYKLASYVPDQRVELAPNPFYNVMPPAMQGGRVLPRPARIVFTSVSADPTGFTAALAAPTVGVDEAEGFQTTDLPLLSRLSHYHVHVQNGLSLFHLELNRDNRFLADVRVRRALALAIDKVTLVHQVFPQIVHPAAFVAHTFYPPDHPFANKDVISRYDPAEAQRLLQAGGYCTAQVNRGCRQVIFSMVVPKRPPVPLAAEILTRAWRKVGIVVTINRPVLPVAYGGLFATWDQNGILAHRRFDLVLYAVGMTSDPDVTSYFNPQFIPTAASHAAIQSNTAAVDDPMLSHDLAQGLRTVGFSARKHWYDLAQERVADQVYWIPLYVRQNITIDNGTVINYKPNPTATNDWNVWEWSKQATP